MAKATKVVVRQVRSKIGRQQRTHRVLEALGLGRIGREKSFELSPSVEGMIRRVRHLVSVREVK